jgi:hypothetical protein
MAKLEQHAYSPFPNYEDYDDVMEGFRAEDEAFQKLWKASEALERPHIIGGLLGWGRGDGTAWYIVTDDNPLTLAWVAYSDRWQVEPELIRGLRKADVIARLHAPRIFGARNVPRG